MRRGGRWLLTPAVYDVSLFAAKLPVYEQHNSAVCSNVSLFLCPGLISVPEIKVGLDNFGEEIFMVLTLTQR